MHSLTFNDLLQTVAAFLIFVIGYLALAVSLIAGVIAAVWVYGGARQFWSYAVRFCAPNHRFSTEETGQRALSSLRGCNHESPDCEGGEIPTLALNSTKL